MFEIKVEAQFKTDYKRTMRVPPQLKSEFIAAIVELAAHHLSDGLVDVAVLYLPHKTNPVIRLVRMGSHDELFQGPQG
jgi:mRNA interferase YafQ